MLPRDEGEGGRVQEGGGSPCFQETAVLPRDGGEGGRVVEMLRRRVQIWVCGVPGCGCGGEFERES